MNRVSHQVLLPTALAAGLGFAVQPAADAAILANESFEYTGGSFIQGQNGGTGFSSAWLGAPNFFAQDARAVPGLSYPGYAVSGQSAEMSAANFRDHHRFLDVDPSGPFTDYLDGSGNIGADGTELWISYLGADNTTSLGGGKLDLRLHRDLALASPNAEPPGGNIVLQLELDDLNGVTPDLLVAHIQFGAGQDTVTIYINPDLSQAPTGGSVLDLASTVDVSFDAIEMAGEYFANNPIPSGTFDEIRIAETATDIGFVIPEPSSLLLASAGLILAARRRRILG
ncbi:MAG: PEP-CTERM sorting domain-containing protein [Planctomycetota bacterium]